MNENEVNLRFEKEQKRINDIAHYLVTWVSLVVITIAICITAVIILGCGASSGTNSQPAPAPAPKTLTQVTCTGCPAPPPDTYLWAYATNFSLLIDGLPADNTAMVAFQNYPSLAFCLRQFNSGTSTWKRTVCQDYTSTKPGAYDATYLVWDGLGQFCINDKWCSINGPAYLELYVDDGILPWSVFAIPEMPPPYIQP